MHLLQYLKKKVVKLFIVGMFIHKRVHRSSLSNAKTIPFEYSVAPALLRQATYGTIKIGMYHGIKRIIVKDPKGCDSGQVFTKKCFHVCYM